MSRSCDSESDGPSAGEVRNKRILVIDDQRQIHDDFRKILAARNELIELDDMESALFGDGPKSVRETYDIDSAYQGEEGYRMVAASVEADRRYALAFVDMRMPPGWDGVRTIEKIWEADPGVQIVICTAFSDYSWESLLDKFGHVDRLLILRKPFDTAEVCQLACALTEKWHLARHAHLKLAQLRGMVDEQTRQLRSEIEERKRSESALRESEERYALAAAGSNDGLWDWNLETGEVYYSPRWKAMIGCAAGEIGGTLPAWLERVSPDDRERLRAELDAHAEGRVPHMHCEYRIRHADGQERWMMCRGLVGRDAAGRGIRMAGWQSDITDRKLAEEQLRHTAFHDLLTGLANRSLLRDRLERCFLNLKRRPDEQFAVMFLDLDKFKRVNDQYGHLVGDQLLIGVAERLTACVRGLDTAARMDPGANELARIGGDEFVILLERIRGTDGAIAVARRVLESFETPFHFGGIEIRAGTSIGIAVSRPEYERVEEILRDADTALYHSKSEGRGRYAVFDQSMHAMAMSRWDMETELKQALEKGALSLRFQPVIALGSGEIFEMEALARWVHPSKGEIPPSVFIPIAEETGMIAPLGDWVLQAACERLAEWQGADALLKDLSVSVNVSGKQFAQPSFVGNMNRILALTGVNPRHLRLEITENAIVNTAPQSLSIMGQLREMDVHLHLDDFGTGYFSLAYLRGAMIDALKIDSSYVRTMGGDPMNESIVKAIIALAHGFGFKTIAEGVESVEEMNHLGRLGCDAVQGYAISRPILAEDVAGYLIGNRMRPGIAAA